LPKVEWTEDAIEDLQRLDKPIAKRVLNKISWFSHHFNNVTSEPLSGDFSGTYKLRIGNWRDLYTIETDVIVIQAIAIEKNLQVNEKNQAH
jgi:mRNA interferase RelE/StbE